jgi:hypothetical protein
MFSQSFKTDGSLQSSNNWPYVCEVLWSQLDCLVLCMCFSTPSLTYIFCCASLDGIYITLEYCWVVSMVGDKLLSYAVAVCRVPLPQFVLELSVWCEVSHYFQIQVCFPIHFCQEIWPQIVYNICSLALFFKPHVCDGFCLHASRFLHAHTKWVGVYIFHYIEYLNSCLGLTSVFIYSGGSRKRSRVFIHRKSDHCNLLSSFLHVLCHTLGHHIVAT